MCGTVKLHVMPKVLHTFYVITMVLIVVAVTIWLAIIGLDYYALPVEERFYHPQYDWFKPSGSFGHGLGIFGTLMMVVGVLLYIARKKYGFLERQIRLKYMLEFHIFFCTLGPILVLFHTTFKFNGIVSVAFWSMVIVVASGVIGKFIHIRIPRAADGTELSFEKAKSIHNQFKDRLRNFGILENEEQGPLPVAKSLALVRKSDLAFSEKKLLKNLIKEESKLRRRLSSMVRMKKLMEYWHVAHKPFAIILLVILVIHVLATLAFGYKWIF